MTLLKKILVLFAATYMCSCYGISITYQTNFMLQEDGQKWTCDNILDIDDGVSCFYNINEYRMAVVSDSIDRCGGNGYDAIEIWKKQKLLGAKFPFSVYKNYPSKKQVTVTYSDLMYNEPMPEFNWILTDKDTVILGYHAYGAQTQYRGRTWNVFYVPDIAIEDGPWKFCGLPGLIMYAEDTTGAFSFEAIGVSNKISRSTLTPWQHNQKSCTPKQMMNLVKLLFWDDEKYLFQTLGLESQSYDAQGRRMMPAHKKACLIEIP